MTENYISENFPNGYIYLKENEKTLRAREHGLFDNKNWFLFGRQQGISEVEQAKIITPEISLGSNMSYDDLGSFYHNTKCYSFIKFRHIKEDYKYFLCILNSSIMWYFLKNTGYVLRGGYFTFKTKYLFPFPLPKTPDDVSLFIQKADIMLAQNKNLQQQQSKFLNFIQAELNPQKLSNKLQHYYKLSWDEFKTELSKAKADFKHYDLKQLREWQTEFETEKQAALAIKSMIEQTDKEIDNMVYALYDLTADDIAIIENNT
jgi:hypothetical protein